MKTAEKKVPATPEKRKRQTPEKPTTAPTEAVVTAVRLRIRKEPSTEAETVRYLVRGEHVACERHDDVWSRVTGGYVMSEYVAPVGD